MDMFDTYDIVINGFENLKKLKEEYKTIGEYEKFTRKSNPCIKENDVVRFFCLVDGEELIIKEF